MLRADALFLAALFLVVGIGSPRAKDPSSPINEGLRAELRAMAKEDQAETAASRADRRVERLRAIIHEYGWPGNSLVGREGARAAWLIAQHADFDREFRHECLAAIEEAYLLGDVDGHDLAYLTDRVASAEGKPQIYGTQGAHGYTPEREAEIDARRHEVGLPSLAAFRAMVARGEYARIHEPGW
jgi:hypothetical protein